MESLALMSAHALYTELMLKRDYAKRKPKFKVIKELPVLSSALKMCEVLILTETILAKIQWFIVAPYFDQTSLILI